MSLEAKMQQIKLSGGGGSGSAQVRPESRPGTGMRVVLNSDSRTYINVNPVAVAARQQGGRVTLISNYPQMDAVPGVCRSSSGSPANVATLPGNQRPRSSPQVPAIPHSQAVKKFVEPSYSTLLQLQTDCSSRLPAQPFAYYANYSDLEAVRSSDSQGSNTEEELSCLTSSGVGGAHRASGAVATYYGSPPSPVSSSYSELRQATRGGLLPLGSYLYQSPGPAAAAANANNYMAVYEQVVPHQYVNVRQPAQLSRQALLQHQQLNSSSEFFGLCHKCSGRIVGEGSGCSAMGKVYHIHCFRCHGCQCLLQGKPFYSLDGKPLCEADYLNTLEKCCNCLQPILDRILRATGKPYHPQCFKCVVCNKSLDGIPFTVDAANQIHCIDDFHRKFAPRCSVCCKPIMPEPGLEETVRVVALDRSFHVNCYRCEDCGLVLSSEAEGRGCYPLDDHVLCKQCNTKRIQLLTQKIQ